MPVLLFVDPLPVHFTSDDLRSLFERYGPVVMAEVVCDPSGYSIRFGRVKMEREADAFKACESLSGKRLAGQPLIVVYGEGGLRLPHRQDEGGRHAGGGRAEAH